MARYIFCGKSIIENFTTSGPVTFAKDSTKVGSTNHWPDGALTDSAAQQIVGPEPREATFASSVILRSCSVAPWPGQLRRSALQLRSMFRLFSSLLFLIVAQTAAGLIQCQTQTRLATLGWAQTSACQIRFSVPKNFKNQHVKGIDSCFAEFRSSRSRLTIEAGSLFQSDNLGKTEMMSDFTVENVVIDGKNVQIATYKDTQDKSKRKFHAQFYVTLCAAQPNCQERSVHLLMSAEGQSANEIEIAKQIFRSVRFDPYRPFLITW
jgi:hypothetical protein